MKFLVGTLAVVFGALSVCISSLALPTLVAAALVIGGLYVIGQSTIPSH